MKNRIKFIRKDKLDKTQTQLGQELGVSRDVISNIELGRVDPPDTFIQLFCMKFNINESWLRTGEGEMFVQTKTLSLDELAKKNNLTPLELDIVKALMTIDEKTRQSLISHFKNAFAYHAETAATVPVRPLVNDNNLTVAQKRELMNQQLDLEEKTKISSVSTTTSGSEGLA